MAPVLRVGDGAAPVLCSDQESLGGVSPEGSCSGFGSGGAAAGSTLPGSLHEDWVDSAAARSLPPSSPQTTSSAAAAGSAEPPSHPLPHEDEEANAADENGTPADPSSDDGFSDVGEAASDTEVVYVKEGVCVWPTRSERIMGRLSLIKQHSVLFLAWLPYSPGCLLEDGSFLAAAAALGDGSGSMHSARDATMYAVHPVPLSEIKAVHRQSPPLGYQSITLTFFNGVSLPPLYFHHGGVKSFFSALRLHASLVRSADDPNTFLVNDTADPLQRSLSTLELPDVLIGGPPAHASSTFAPPGGLAGGEGELPLRVQLAELVDKLQRFSQNARDTASSIFGAGSVMLGSAPLGEHAALLGAAVVAQAGADPQEVLAARQAAADRLEAQRAQQQEGGEEDEKGVDVGTDVDLAQQRSRCEASSSLGAFELIERAAPGEGSSLWTKARPPPLTLEELGTFLDAEGRLADEAAFRQRVFYGGCEPEARPEVWRFLLGVHTPGSTSAERRADAAQRRQQYVSLRQQWRSISEQQAARWAKWRERRGRIDKDVRRTDRGQRFFAREHSQAHEMLRNILLTYSLYNFDLGYCQGLSDLAAPILYVMRGTAASAPGGGSGGRLGAEEQLGVEAEAFWCFARLMDRMEPNFSTDSRGMHAQLVALRQLVQLLDPPLYAYLEERDCLNCFFCFRWVLILFKREFSFEEVLRLWEALWTGLPTRQLHLFMCVAALEHQRRRILAEDLDFDGLLKLCIDLSGRLALEPLLRDAEALARYAGAAGAEIVAGLP